MHSDIPMVLSVLVGWINLFKVSEQQMYRISYVQTHSANIRNLSGKIWTLGNTEEVLHKSISCDISVATKNLPNNSNAFRHVETLYQT